VTLRDEWRDFITDPGRAGRHLTNLGTSVKATADTPLDPAVLAAFLEKLSDGANDVSLVAGIIDLASGGYEDFCTRQLPPLLDSLSNEKVDEVALVGPMLRGSTRWDLTTLGRLSGRLLPTQFVTRLPQRSFALPENALVRWLVEDLAATIDWIEGRVGSKALLPQLAGIRDGCEEALRHQWFREVPPPRWLDVHMRLAAQRQRLPAYRRAAGLAVRRQGYRERNRAARWQHIIELLTVNWLAPLSDDDLFELYALVLVLDVLEHDLGLQPPTQYGLAAPGRDHIALFEHGANRVRVFFDQSPASALGYPSYQLTILAAHDGVRGVPRRPDLVVVCDGAQGRRVAFVEVKKTADSGYISDSVYKALGYLSDFRAIWAGIPSNPKIVVLFPEAIAPKTATKIAEQEVILASSADRATVAAALQAGLGL
jgi:hypothetical protein